MTLLGVAASILISFLASFLFAYILFWFDRYEKEPFLLLGGVFLWGAIVAAGGAFILNTVLGVGVYFLTGSQLATEFTTASVIAPIIEELLKGFAVLLVFWVFRNEFDSVLDGIVYAGVTALGFAATENAFYIFSYGFAESGWEGFAFLAFIRLVLVGWQHPFYTAFFGIGLAVARLNRSVLVKLIGPIIGLGLAMASHALHNFLASLAGSLGGLAFTTLLDWFGWFLMLVFIIIAIAQERKVLVNYLRDEVQKGTLTQSQYETVISALRVSFTRLSAIPKGNYGKTTRFYKRAAQLALKKRHLHKLGEEKGNTQTVKALREKVTDLSRAIRTA
jgi:RsiW-degrading membrane proteinase PrsW (M82 family)